MADEMPMLLSELDKAIKERPLYIKKRLEYLERLNKMLDNSETNEQRYHILGELYSGYSSFNADLHCMWLVLFMKLLNVSRMRITR